MMLKILGWLWIALGIWWVLRPQGVKKRFRKGFRRKLRTFLFLGFLLCAGLLFSGGRSFQAPWSVLLPAAGAILLLKGLFFIRGKASEVVLDWWEEQPESAYRVAGVLVLVAGLLVQWFTHRPSS